MFTSQGAKDGKTGPAEMKGDGDPSLQLGSINLSPFSLIAGQEGGGAASRSLETRANTGLPVSGDGASLKRK